MSEPVFGVIVGNRGFFPDHLCESGRKTVLKVLDAEGINSVALTPEDTSFGSVESLGDAQKCADLFKKHKEEIDGVLVTLVVSAETKSSDGPGMVSANVSQA